MSKVPEGCATDDTIKLLHSTKRTETHHTEVCWECKLISRIDFEKSRADALAARCAELEKDIQRVAATLLPVTPGLGEGGKAFIPGTLAHQQQEAIDIMQSVLSRTPASALALESFESTTGESQKVEQMFDAKDSQ